MLKASFICKPQVTIHGVWSAYYRFVGFLDMQAHLSRGFNHLHAPLLTHTAKLRNAFKECKASRKSSSRWSRRHCTATVADALSNGHIGSKYVITTPLYYVNAAPHMGSAYTTIAADTAARFQRLSGQDVQFVTGTDEHGEKIAAAASAQSLSPQEHCDRIAKQFQELWEKLNISYNAWIRTTQSDHEALVCSFLQRVKDKGDIYKDTYEGYYCIGCEKYMDEEEMDDKHVCKTHKTMCELRKEENYFFRLSSYQKEIEDLLEQNQGFIMPASRRNEVMGWVTSGLKDFSLSRSKVEWGIRVPWDASQTFYVWTDALMGYLTAILKGTDISEEGLQAVGWPANVHIVGKDIIRFHTVMWPALLMSAGFPTPKRVFGHGFLTKDGMKMGKALGNVLDPHALVSTYGADAVRYYFLREIKFGQDGDFSEDRFQKIVNAFLANDVGNCLNRTLGLLHKFCNGQIPLSSADIAEDAVLRTRASESVPIVLQAYNDLDFSTAIEWIHKISGRANQHLEEQAPWTALKKGSDEQKAQGRRVLVEVLEAIRIVALLLSPVTPNLSKAAYFQLGFSESDFESLQISDASWGGLQAGHQTAKPEPIFTRLEQDFVTEPPQKPATMASK